MCKLQTGCNDTGHFICNKCHSNPAKDKQPTASIKDEQLEANCNANLSDPLLLKTPTAPSPTQHHPSLNPLYSSTPHPKNNNNDDDHHVDDDDHHHHRFSLSSWVIEAKAISDIALPMVLTGLLLYSRSIISMLFLGRLGELPLAGGSLAVGFANITGYSVLSGLAIGMEPICGQAFGAQKHSLLSLTLYRTILLLLLSSLPISLLWLHMDRILLLFGQHPAIAAQAQTYLLYSLPDLLAQSLLHPLRIFLRTQSITIPLTITSALAIALHFPLNYLLVFTLKLDIKGVALASVFTNFMMLIFLFIYLLFSDPSKLGLLNPVHKPKPGSFSFSPTGFKELVQLAVPSCISVCLEWWWYEIMILLCGLLTNPQATVASMGILIQTTSLIYIFPSSLGASLSTRVGNELGADRPIRAKRAAITGLFFSYILGFSALLFAYMVRGSWAAMFTKDVEIMRLTTLVLPIIGLCELGNCPQTTLCGVLRGTARPKVGANINLGCFYMVGMPVAVWLGFFAGFDFQGLWLGLLAAQGSCVLTMMRVLYSTDWEFQAQRAKKLTDHSYNTDLLVDEEDEKKIHRSKHDDQPSLLV